MNPIFSKPVTRATTPIEEEKITKLLQAAMGAPAEAEKKQAWKFIVVDNPDILTIVGNAIPHAGSIKSATMAIVIASNQHRDQEAGLWQGSLGAACENILIEAVALGLDAICIGITPISDRMHQIAEALRLPEGMTPYAIIPIGYTTMMLFDGCDADHTPYAYIPIDYQNRTVILADEMDPSSVYYNQYGMPV